MCSHFALPCKKILDFECYNLSFLGALLLILLCFRLREERPRHPLHCDFIKAVAEAVSVPIIAK